MKFSSENTEKYADKNATYINIVVSLPFGVSFKMLISSDNNSFTKSSPIPYWLAGRNFSLSSQKFLLGQPKSGKIKHSF